MAQNGGHVYFSVHLKNCPECRVEFERRTLSNDYLIVWVVFTVCLAVGFFLAALYWNGDFDSWNGPFRKRRF